MFGRNPVALLARCVKLAHEQAPSANVYKYARGGLSRRAYIYARGGQRVKFRSKLKVNECMTRQKSKTLLNTFCRFNNNVVITEGMNGRNL